MAAIRSNNIHVLLLSPRNLDQTARPMWLSVGGTTFSPPSARWFPRYYGPDDEALPDGANVTPYHPLVYASTTLKNA
jgi:hypothetical protein